MYAISAIAENFPFHRTANGKSMLAQLSDAEVEQKIGRVFPARIETTRTTLRALLTDLHEARRTGLAYDLQEHTLSVCAVGVGSRDALGNRLALSMPISSSRFSELKPKAAERLLELRGLLVARFASK